jgi:hypothetical protein
MLEPHRSAAAPLALELPAKELTMIDAGTEKFTTRLNWHCDPKLPGEEERASASMLKM